MPAPIQVGTDDQLRCFSTLLGTSMHHVTHLSRDAKYDERPHGTSALHVIGGNGDRNPTATHGAPPDAKLRQTDNEVTPTVSH